MDEEDDEIAEDHLAKAGGPIKCQESADAAEGERHHPADAEPKSRGDDTQAIAHGLHREPIEPSAHI
jgi:hypothetical protein